MKPTNALVKREDCSRQGLTNLITYAVHLHVDQQMMHFGQLKVSQSKKKKKKPIGKLADCLSNASGSSNALLE